METSSDTGPATIGDVMASAHPCLRGMPMASPRPDPFEGIRISERAPIAEAAALMLKTGAWMLVVVDDRNKMVGMVIRDQLIHAKPRPYRRRGPSVAHPAALFLA